MIELQAQQARHSACFTCCREEAPVAKNPTGRYPVIDTNRCGADNDCVDLCEANVLAATNERLEPVIAHPDLCVEGCTLCVDICSKDALSIPGAVEVVP
jgi:NAD-dependent dihydropyrimidine dehydrogenase PreA subunit